MPILVMCQYSDNAPELSKTHLQAHLDYVEAVVAMICVAGPLGQSIDAMKNETHDGRCFIFDTDDISIARKLLDHDPYSKAGVYSQVAFARFTADAGHWVGGVSWK